MADTTVAATATAPQVVLHDNGNAVAVWQQREGPRETIWADSYSPSAGWGTPTRIELISPNTDTRDALAPQIGMDAAGNAIAVWTQFDGPRSDIWANRYTASTGTWGTATLIVRIERDPIGSMESPELTVSRGGNAMVVWTQV